MKNTNLPTIVSGSKDTILQKEQRLFNKLITQISNKRELLIKWQESIVKFKQTYSNDYFPLGKQYADLRIKMAYLMNEVYDNKLFTKSDRKKMLYIIHDVVDESANEDENLKHIYNTRSDEDYDKQQEYTHEMEASYIKEMAKEHLDIDIDSNIDSPEDIIEYIAQEMQNKHEQQQAIKQKRKKSAKALAKEAQQMAEEKNVSQSIREVYRQLVRVLHPDRKSEHMDHESKTTLMQKVNAAYDKQDLLTLLEVQLQIEHIDPANLNSIAMEKLKHFNKILKMQLNELEGEIHHTCSIFSCEFNLSPIYVIHSPSIIINKLHNQIEDIKESIDGLNLNLELWKDIKELKKYVKGVKL